MALGCGWTQQWVARFGESTAWIMFNVYLGTLFQLQALGLSAACQLQVLPMFTDLPLDEQSLFVATTEHAQLKRFLLALASVLLVCGFVSKMAAVWAVGLDVYFCKDMVLNRPADTGFVVTGIYKVFQSPMYSVGNLHTYALALFTGRWPGVIAAAVYQASIYGFDFLVEQPFIRRTYGPKTTQRD